MRVKYPAKLPTSLVGWVIGGPKRRLTLTDIAHPHGGRHYRTSRDSPATHSYDDRRGRHETRPGPRATADQRHLDKAGRLHIEHPERLVCHLVNASAQQATVARPHDVAVGADVAREPLRPPGRRSSRRHHRPRHSAP
jgi:hypothetical protein